MELSNAEVGDHTLTMSIGAVLGLVVVGDRGRVQHTAYRRSHNQFHKCTDTQEVPHIVRFINTANELRAQAALAEVEGALTTKRHQLDTIASLLVARQRECPCVCVCVCFSVGSLH